MTSHGYVIILGKPEDEAVIKMSQLLINSNLWEKYYLSTESIIFLERKQRYYVANNTQGILFVIGVLFDKAYNLIEHSHFQKIFDSNFNDCIYYLSQNFWGDYIAYRMINNGENQIFRSCSGGIACYAYHNDKDYIIFSNPDQIRLLLCRHGHINWSNVINSVFFNRYISRDTAITEVADIIPGELVSIKTNHVTRSVVWSPVSSASRSLSETTLPDAQKVRETIIKCISAHAAPFSTISVSLSGGLDSSIILTSLVHNVCSQRKLTACFNIYDIGAGSSEQYLAKIISQKFGVPLSSADVGQVSHRLEQSSRQIPITLRASKNIITKHSALLQERFVETWGVDAIFYGTGGDAIFLVPRPGLIASDYVRQMGIKGSWSYLFRDAIRSRRSLFEIAQTVFKYGLLAKPYNPVSSLHRSINMLTEQARDTALSSALLHPWVEQALAHHLPPSKCLQIFGIVDALYFQSYHQGITNVSTILPIMSYPLLDLFLSLPSWFLVPGILDRGLVRQGFLELLPDEIVYRRGKGSASAHYSRLFLSNITWIERFLLDGALVGHKILDATKMYKCFHSDEHKQFFTQVKLLEYVALEDWVRHLLYLT